MQEVRGWALVQTGRRAGQGSVPEGSGSLRAFGGSARSARVSCASRVLATAVEGGQTRRLGTWGHGGAVERGGGGLLRLQMPLCLAPGHLGAFMGAVGVQV